jgi:hypothetical protein
VPGTSAFLRTSADAVRMSEPSHRRLLRALPPTAGAGTGQVSQCSRSDAGWACKVVPDERSALETEIARLQGENATLKKELSARELPLPNVPSPPTAKPGEPELKLPSDAEVDKMISFLEKVWRRLIETMTTVQKDVEKKN